MTIHETIKITSKIKIINFGLENELYIETYKLKHMNDNKNNNCSNYIENNVEQKQFNKNVLHVIE